MAGNSHRHTFTPLSVILLLLVCLSGSSLYAQQAEEPTAGPAPDFTVRELTEDSATWYADQFNTYSEMLATEQAHIEREFLALESQYAPDTNKSVPESESDVIKQAIILLSRRMEYLEKVENLRQQQQVANEKIRYCTGRIMLENLIDNSGKMATAFALSESIASYHTMTNPMNWGSVSTELREVCNTLDPANQSLLMGILNGLTGGGSQVTPWVTIASGIASIFTSRKMEKDEKARRAMKLISLINETADSTPDVMYINNTVSALREQSEKFHEETKAQFCTYVGTVGYTTTWPEYVTAIRSTPYDPLEEPITTYFDGIRAQMDPSKPVVNDPLGTSRYQVEMVRERVMQYEQLLTQVDVFCDEFIDILNKHKASINGNALLAEKEKHDIIKSLDDIITRITDVKTNFADRYRVIPASAKRVLIGIH
jgi:hypothetical protein